MKPLTLDEIVEVTGGALVDGPEKIGESGEETVTSVSTDTRTLERGALFVTLKGARDGHTYLDAAREKGAAAFMVERTLHLDEAHLPHVVVSDALDALGDIARHVRDDFHGPVVAVTGSVGKTTAKEMIAHVLAAAFTVLKSEANFNNEIGVPRTLFQLTDAHTAIVVEMGMRGEGQIRRLVEIAAPTVGVITNIGLSHIELLGTQEAIADAKGELLEGLPPDTGLAVLPAGDAFLERLRAKFAGKILTCALDGTDADIQATDIVRQGSGYRCHVKTPWGETELTVPSPGRFNVLNALFAVAVAGHLGVPLAGVAGALASWTAPPMRLESQAGANGVSVLNDAYNAAPDSMVGALQTLLAAPVGPNGKRIAVLGEMRELGIYADEGHRLVGRAAAKYAPDMIVTVGEMGTRIVSGAVADGFSLDNIHQFESTAEAARLLPLIVQPGDAVLVKGSRALAMEQIVVALGVSAEETATADTAPPLVPAASPAAAAQEADKQGIASATDSPAPPLAAPPAPTDGEAEEPSAAAPALPAPAPSVGAEGTPLPANDNGDAAP